MLDDDVRTWWSERPAEQRSVLTAAAREFRMDAPVRDLLTQTACPLGPPEEKLQHGGRFLWPELLRRVLLEEDS